MVFLRYKKRVFVKRNKEKDENRACTIIDAAKMRFTTKINAGYRHDRVIGYGRLLVHYFHTKTRVGLNSRKEATSVENFRKRPPNRIPLKRATFVKKVDLGWH